MGHRRGFEVSLPTVPLDRLYGPSFTAGLRNTASASCSTTPSGRSTSATAGAGTGTARRRRDRRRLVRRRRPVSRCSICCRRKPSTPFPRSPGCDNWRLLLSPVSIYGTIAPITPLPHVVLIDCVGQWLFNRGEVAPGEHYVQVVVSAARPFRGLVHDEVRRRIMEELARLFPAAAAATVLRGRVVTEQAATFSATPGVDQWRPAQASPLPNLLLAGDWTATGWPATMEGAVRSGYLAAEALLTRNGSPQRLLRPEFVRSVSVCPMVRLGGVLGPPHPPGPFSQRFWPTGRESACDSRRASPPCAANRWRGPPGRFPR